MLALTLHPSSRLIDRAHIAAPCKASWDDMVGDERTRFCGGCAKNVYNVAFMSADEAEQLIVASEGRACLRLYRRKDGTVITSDCPVGLAERAYKQARRAVLASVALIVTMSAGVLGVFSKPTCANDSGASEVVMGKMMAPDPAPARDVQPLLGEPVFVPEPEGEVIMGDVALPEPRMGRVKVR